MQDSKVKSLQFGTLKVEVYPDKEAAGLAAARFAAKVISDLAASRDSLGVIFATGASQLAVLDALTSLPGIPWNKIHGFHMDEYVGLSVSHTASFRHYMRERLTSKVQMKEFSEINGEADDLERSCRDYAEKIRSANPALCLLGVGENGHLAFNDPLVADFKDPLAVKVVRLDATCRNQQVEEGWFPSVAQVPERAITLTIPTLFHIPRLIASVPGKRKAKIVPRALKDPISTACPATILRTHPNTTMYLDLESASELGDMLKG